MQRNNGASEKELSVGRQPQLTEAQLNELSVGRKTPLTEAQLNELSAGRNPGVISDEQLRSLMND